MAESAPLFRKKVIEDFTDFYIKDGNGSKLTAVSAVCCWYGTLYMFSKSSCNERQFVLCDSLINGSDPVFLEIGNHHPVSLFGGKYISRDINKAIYYFTLSSNHNNSYAQFYLGEIYYKGKYISRDINKAIHYLTL